MQAYGIDYMFNGHLFIMATVDAKNTKSAKHKIGRRHGLKAAEAEKAIKITKVVVLGYY